MAKKQTRRSVSIRGATYDRIRQYCERSGTSMSEFVEGRIADFFISGGSAPVERPPVSLPQKVAPVVKPKPQQLPVTPKKASPKNGNGNGSGSDVQEEEKLDFDEMQNAARFFTF